MFKILKTSFVDFGFFTSNLIFLCYNHALILFYTKKGFDLAIKEDINALKQEIGAEEQFLESIIKGERFFKKYKIFIIAIVVIALLLGIGYGVFDTIKNNRIKSANIAYEMLLKNPQNTKALEELKSSSDSLYNVYLFHMASQKQDKKALQTLASNGSDLDALLKDIVNYELQNGNSQALKDLDVLIKGYKQLKSGNVKAARATFSAIALTSPLQEVVKQLMHYQDIRQ